MNNLLVPGSGWVLTSAAAINDNGQIVGEGEGPSGYPHAFLLTPVPEPSGLALLGVGAGGFLAFAWRRRRLSRKIIACAAVLLALFASLARADVFNMPNGETSLLTVPVGDPGNASSYPGGPGYGRRRLSVPDR